MNIRRYVKTLVVPMQGSIGAAVPSYLERTYFDHVMLVHPWSKNGAAHHNALGLADYFRSRLMRFRAKKRDSRETEFEVIAMKCSQKPLEISEYFCQSLRRDYDEKNRESADDSVSGGLFYDVLLGDETPVGYIIGTMQLSVDRIPIRCHITSLGYDIRKPLRHEFKPEKSIGDSFEMIPLIAQRNDTIQMLRRKNAVGNSLKNIHQWYKKSEVWQNSFEIKEISEFSKETGLHQTVNVLSNHVKTLCGWDPQVIEKLEHAKYRITHFGRSLDGI